MRAVVLSSAFAIAVIVGCSATPDNHTFVGTGANGSGAGGSGANGTGAGSTGTETGIGGGFVGSSSSGGPGCSAAAELVYVLSTKNDLYSFQPAMKQFTLIGHLGCNPPHGATPNSMAVDREANAWVNYVANDTISNTGGWVYKVSTADASCAAAPSVTITDPAWYQLGMGFSSDTSGGTTETLFVTGTGMIGAADSPGLGKIDLTTFTLSPIAQFSGDQNLVAESAELTGTGDARLFGFFTTSPVRVAQLAKTGADITDWSIASVPVPMAWAFSFWGGDFYLYTSKNGTSDSTVTKFDPTTQQVDTTYVLKAPAVIDGAGVSTCAPVMQTQ